VEKEEDVGGDDQDEEPQQAKGLDDNESDEDGESDDYERALTEYVKLRVGSSSKNVKKKKKKAVRDAIVFKLRVLDLVEAIIKMAPGASAVPLLAQPLLTACEQCSVKSRDESLSKELISRVKGVGRKLFRSSRATTAPSRDLAIAIFSDSLQLARRATNKEVAKLALEAAGYALNLTGDGGRDCDLDLIGPVIKDVVQGRGVHVGAKALVELFDAQSEMAVASFPFISQYVPRTPFQQGEVCLFLFWDEILSRTNKIDRYLVLRNACA